MGPRLDSSNSRTITVPPGCRAKGNPGWRAFGAGKDERFRDLPVSLRRAGGSFFSHRRTLEASRDRRAAAAKLFRKRFRKRFRECAARLPR